MAFISDLFSLQNNWKLTLPVDSSGKNSGEAYETTQLKGYESPYFYDSAEGAMVFVAHVDGATTTGTKYARSELRELNNGKNAAWKLAQGGTMTATVRIDEVPVSSDKARIMIGQIHGKSSELIRLYWEKDTVYFMNDKAGSSNKETKFVFTSADGKSPSISLGEKFSYKIDAHGDTLKVDIYADGQTYTSVSKINSVWQSDTFYFKAGVYLGVNESSGSGQAKVSFFGLDFGHTPGSGLGGLQTTTPPAVDPEPNTPVTSVKPAPQPQPETPSVNLVGTSGNDTLQGDASDNILDGGSGTDILHGGAGNDRLIGNDGNDTAAGGEGRDTFVVSRGDGGLKITDFAAITDGDVLLVEGYSTAELASAQFSQSGTDVLLRLADGATVTFGNALLADILNANLHADIKGIITSFNPVTSLPPVIPPVTEPVTPPVVPPVVVPPVVVSPVSELPTPTKIGSDAKETLKGSNKVADVIMGHGGDDTLYGEDGNDWLYGENGNDKLYGNDHNDHLDGGAGNDTLYGEGDNDVLFGGDGNDKLYGDRGDDILNGGLGQDHLYGGKGKDVFVFTEFPDVHDIIFDFSKSEDRIDIDALLGTSGVASIGKYNGDSALYVDPDGAGSAKAVLIATFETSVDPSLLKDILA